MRVELTFMDGLVITKLFATNGRLLGKGYGLTEDASRADAAEDMITQESEIRGRPLARYARACTTKDCEEPRLFGKEGCARCENARVTRRD